MFKAKNKTIYVMLIAIFALILSACGDGSDNESKENDKPSEKSGSTSAESISFVTGGPGGTFYPLGVGMADVINEAGIANVTVETSEDRKSTRLNSSHVAISYA